MLGGGAFRLTGHANGTFGGARNGRPLFACAGNARVVTTSAGAVTGVVGISASVEAVRLLLPGVQAVLALTVAPNERWDIRGGAPPVLAGKAPFALPFE